MTRSTRLERSTLHRRRQRPHRRLLLEPLEDRRMLATFVVNSTLDDPDGDSDDGICDTGNATGGFTGVCTFRAATITANNVNGFDRVHFDIPGEGVPTINLFSGASQFRTLTDPIIIDGTTQSAGMVELNGAGVSGDGLVFELAASGSEVRGLVMNRFGESALVINADNMTVAGNYIGTDRTGGISDPDGAPDSGDEFGNGGSGVAIGTSFSASGFVGGRANVIGGTNPADRNVISGNMTGVSIFSPANALNRVLGNFIGTDVTGATSLSNGRGGGINLGSTGSAESTGGNIIGGVEAGAGNIISGNGVGVSILSDNNLMLGNFVGVDVTGEFGIGNANDGVVIFGDGNTIGGDAAEDANVISANQTGVAIERTGQGNVVNGNFIGTNLAGDAAIGNQFGVTITDSPENIIGGAAGNVISGNTQDGVVIGDSPPVLGDAVDNLIVGNRIGTNALGTAKLGNGRHGVRVNASANSIGGVLPGTSSTVGNVISGNGEFGVVIGGGAALDNVVQGNRIGTNAAGTAQLGNAFDGIWLSAGARNTIVGGLSDEQRNVISGNAGDGVLIFGAAGFPAMDNVIIGNLIGTNLAGTAKVPNGFRGVHIDQHAAFNIVGGTTAAERNIISGNGSDGVIVALPTANGNRVIGNFIGTDVAGLAAIPNQKNGVFLFNSPDNEVGGSESGEGNVISGNLQSGVRIEGTSATNNFVRGNLIGTDKNGALPLGNQSAGVFVMEASNNHIGGQRVDEQFVTGNTIAANEHGVRIEGSQAARNEVLGNNIGTNSGGSVIDPDGDPNNGNGLGNRRAGVLIENAPSNRIGLGFEDAILPANIIAGNNDGVLIRGSLAIANLVGGNFIGVDGLGKNPLGNRDNGVFIDAAKDNVIGGFKPGQPLVPGNTISANGNGVLIIDETATGNVVAANKIGTDLDGSLSEPASRLGNTGAGVFIQGAQANFIGQATGADVFCDPATFPANAIGGNRRAGVLVTGDTAQRNAILCNSIFANTAIGIDLNDDGVTPNDSLDADGSPNQRQNFPIISTLEHVENNIRIAGSMSGSPQTSYRLDFFATEASQAASLEHGIQGQRHLGTLVVTADQTGYVHFTTGFLQLLTDTEVVTATATNSQNNTSEFSNFTPDFVAGGIEIRTPVIFVPGFFASFVPESVDDQSYLRFLLRPGLHPDFLVKDPILKAYDDIVTTLDNAGYELGQDLFVAPFDWRLPLGPAGARDGLIDGLTAEQITDEVFEYGVDYLGFWLRRAAEAWYEKHHQSLTSVHLIAHSMGGLLSRTYIQSSAYGGSFSSTVRTDGGQLALPMVANLTMLGVPNRGAAVTFAPWDDNFAGDNAYRLVLSKVIAHAWHKLKKGNVIVVGAGSEINRDEFDFNAADLHPEKVKFLRRYLPGLANLLPEYDGFASNFDLSSALEFENVLLKDLNQSVLSTSRTARSIAMYGTSDTTHTLVEQHQGPNSVDVHPVGTILTPSLGSFTDVSISFPATSQVWYQDIDADNNGDGTVPLQSLEGLFLDDARVERFPYCTSGECRTGDIETGGEVGHTKLPSNVDVQLRILRHLGHPIPPGEISTGSSAKGVGAVSDFNWYNLMNDPVDALLVDQDGRRFGFTQATGILTEIPGSVYFGGGDGIGWIVGQPVNGPLELQLTGLGEEHLVQVSNQFGSLFQGVEDSDFLALGESRRLPVRPLVTSPSGENELLVSDDGLLLDLRLIADSQLRVIESVTLEGAGNVLVLDADVVVEAANQTGVLRVRSNLDDVVEFGVGWSLTGTQTEDAKFFRVLEQGGVRLLLNGPADWRNPINSLDVNRNGTVEPLDVLIIVNELNEPQFHRGTGLLTDAAALTPFPGVFFDVSSDGFVSPLDALLIINFLNNLAGIGEGEPTPARHAIYAEGSSLAFTDISVPSAATPTGVEGTTPQREPERRAQINWHLVSRSPAISAPASRRLSRVNDARSLDDLLAEFETASPGSEPWR